MTGIVLAGGGNTRMGQDKAFLTVDGRRLIDRTVGLLRSLFREVIIVAADPLVHLDQDAALVTDIFPRAGALGGLYTGLFTASDDYAFVVACDIPFLNRPFIEYMTSLADGYDIVVPAPPDGLQPLHADHVLQSGDARESGTRAAQDVGRAGGHGPSADHQGGRRQRAFHCPVRTSVMLRQRCHGLEVYTVCLSHDCQAAHGNRGTFHSLAIV